MRFDLDYEYEGILYCVSIKAREHDIFHITSIEKYLPANNRRIKPLDEIEFDKLERKLIYDNTFVDMVSDEYRHERYK